MTSADQASERVLYQPAAGGESLSYGQILCDFDGGEHPYFPVVRPPDTPALLRALIPALVLGKPLTLFDGDFSEEACRQLGGTPDLFAASEPCLFPVLADLNTFLAALRAANGFTLTLFTSGSTGLPKRVTHTRQTLLRTVRTGSSHSADVWALAFNPTHMAGVQVILQALLNGNPLVDVFRAPQAVIARALERCGITHISATPSFFRLLLPLETPVRGVRSVTLGGEASDGGLHARLRAAFPGARLRNLYASTEAGTVLRAEGEGFVIPAALRDRVRIEGHHLLLHRSLLATFSGGSVEAGEWYDTGDRVEFIDGAGSVFRIVARERPWINVGGDKVDPAEVEAALCAHPAVAAARVYGKANSVLGNLLAAEIVRADGGAAFDELALRRDLAARLQPYKIPRFFAVVPQLSLGRTGKRA
ncbi:MAG: AMP-binding protein [Opitutales bacterium]|nr:AMP-binding protein [Opitutales bacterium]